ncbi:hypothetical protein [Paenibacillus sp. MABNR03]|uniref:hypothetical protein n=1 Tax=Paenibacillus sp. MABNR03 TaxID=3142626 RepID=UPI003D28F321
MGLKVRNIRTTRTRESIFESLFELMEEKDFDKITKKFNGTGPNQSGNFLCSFPR